MSGPSSPTVPDAVAPQPKPDHPLSPARSWALTAAAMLTMAVSYFDRQTFASLAPKVTAELSIREDQYGLLVSAFSLAYLVGSPLSGRIVDRFGARRALVVAVVIWTAVAAFHSVAASFAALFVLRILLGLAEAPSFPGSTQTVTRALPPASRARGFGILFTGSSLGALLAPLGASFLERRYGWNVAFLGTAIAGLLWIPMWLAVTSGARTREVLDRSSPQQKELSATIAATLRLPQVLRGIVVIAASAPLAGFVLNWSAKYLKAAEGVEQGDMGKYLWIAPVLYDLGAVAYGHFTSQFAASTRAKRGLFLLAGVMATALPLELFVSGPYSAMVFAGVALAGVAGLFAMVTADIMSSVPPNAVSTAGGISAAAQSLAYILSNPLVGLAVERQKSYSSSVVVLSLLVLPGVLAYLAWRLPTDEGAARHARSA